MIGTRWNLPRQLHRVCCAAVLGCVVFGAQQVFGAAQTGCGTPASGIAQAWTIDKGVAFKTKGLAVDADGAPDSYLVNGKGLSDNCDGVAALVGGKRVTKKSDPQHWYSICQKAWADAVSKQDFSHVAIFGFLTDKQHRPVLQSSGDPFPGAAYITTTTLTVPGTPDGVQRHFIDAVKIPYIVLPPAFRRSFGVSPGDVAVVYRPKTDATAFAVFGDRGGLGEASVKLHRDLGNEPVTSPHGVARANRGISDPVFTMVFPGVHVLGTLDADAWNRSIRETGSTQLEKWGGKARLQACAK